MSLSSMSGSRHPFHAPLNFQSCVERPRLYVTLNFVESSIVTHGNMWRDTMEQTNAAPHFAQELMTTSDDECIRRLALLVKQKDHTKLGGMVALIARLAPPIELPC